MSLRDAVAVGLVLMVVGSGIGVVYSQHLSRSYFVRLERLKEARDELRVEWGRLQLEQSTWATHGRVERVAREQLDMKTPKPGSVITVRP